MKTSCLSIKNIGEFACVIKTHVGSFSPAGDGYEC